METTKLFLTGNIESDEQVWDCVNEGISWRIRQYKKALEIQKQIKENTLEKQIADTERNIDIYYELYGKYPNVEYWIKEHWAEEIKEREYKLSKLKIKEKYFNNSNKTDIGRLDISKNVPITDLLEFNRTGMAKCLWHKDKTPSMKYYSDTNSVHCFGCGKNGDSIDVFMKLKGCDFQTAINKLLSN